MKTVWKIKPKQTRTAMTPAELLAYYEQVKGSGRVSEVKTKYKRSRDKKVRWE